MIGSAPLLDQSETALSAGADVLFTEDLQDGRIIDGLRVVNPFCDDRGP